MSNHGFLLLTDITGYTAFLSKSELEHAQDILQDLMKVLLEHTTQTPFQFSKLEGDAVFSYVLDGDFKTGLTVVETIEDTYASFRRKIEQIDINTTCTCRACSNIPNLDLKFFVHHGEFFVQDLGAQKDLVGTDVNLVHRLAKNSVTKTTGMKAYAMFSDAAITAIDLPEFSTTLTPHAERYEHLGDVQCFLYDMQPYWEENRSRYGQMISAEEAEAELVYDVIVAPSVLWEYLTHVDTRRYISGSDTMHTTGKKEGRVTAGSIYHCAHGDNVVKWYVTDWKPFEYFSFTNTAPLNSIVSGSFILQPTETGSRLILRAKADQTSLIFRIMRRVMFNQFEKVMGATLQKLVDIVNQEASERNIKYANTAALSQPEIADALESALPTAG